MTTDLKPNVLHIITGLSDGGAEAILFRLCAQDSGSHHHVVSLMDSGKYGPMLEIIGVSVTILNMPRGRVTFSGLWELWKLVRKLQPDTIQTWMYHADLIGGLIGRLAGQRNIVWGIHHTTLTIGESRRSTIFVARLCARLSRLIPRAIICCAERSRAVHAALGYDNARMRVIPNGYDLSVFRPDPAAGHSFRAEIGINTAVPLIGFVARFNPLKDHETLLLALAILKQRGNIFRCVLVGTGVDRTNALLNDRIASHDLSEEIHLLGQRSDIPAVMNALDLHVLSSVSEAFPNVLAEAMACGTPCVSTDVGDAADIIGPAGLIVPPGSPEALANAIAELLAERNTLAWLSRKEAARHHVSERYAIEKMIQSYHEAWSGIYDYTSDNI